MTFRILRIIFRAPLVSIRAGISLQSRCELGQRAGGVDYAAAGTALSRSMRV